MKSSRRTPTTGPLAGSISCIIFEAAINSGRLVTSIPQLQKHILAKTVLLTQKIRERVLFVILFVVIKLQNIVLVVLLDPRTRPYLFVILIVSRHLSSTVDWKIKRYPGLSYLNYHSPEYFGLYRVDAEDAGILKKHWKKPTKHTDILWAQYIKTNSSHLYCQTVSDDVDNNDNSTATITDVVHNMEVDDDDHDDDAINLVHNLSNTDNRNINVLDESNDHNNGDNHDDSLNDTDKDNHNDDDDDDDDDNNNDNDNDNDNDDDNDVNTKGVGIFPQKEQVTIIRA